MSFSESLNQCLFRSIPAVFLVLSGAAMFLASKAQSMAAESNSWPTPRQSNATEAVIYYTKNDLLIGLPDPFFWFLMPFFGIISVGLCVAINYAALIVTHVFAFIYAKVRATPRSDDGR